MGKRSQHSRHLIRMALLFALGISVFLVLRHVLMPEDFGVYGHYRAGAIDDNRVRPTSYAGQNACLACHDDVGEDRAKGRHARLSCEGCHGPLASHASDPATHAARRPDPRATCLRCHSADPARPAKQPQIDVPEHAATGPCTECHKPHQPGLS